MIRTPLNATTMFHDRPSTLLQIQATHPLSGPSGSSEITLSECFRSNARYGMISPNQAPHLVPRLVLGGLWTVRTFLRDLMAPRRSISMTSSLPLVPRLVLGGLWTVINIPRGLEAPQKGSLALKDGSGALQKGPRGPGALV
jgi:hypothetical protein